MSLLFFICMWLQPNLGAGDHVVFIVNSSVAEDKLNSRDLKNIFLGKKSQWSNGDSIVPILLKEDELHETFLMEHLKRTKRQFDTYWKRLIFTGQGTPPKSFTSEKEVIDYVKNTPGAIGYVSSTAQTGDVKTITIAKK